MPHQLPRNNVITWDTGLEDKTVAVPNVNMTASRLMILVSTFAVDILVVWNWRIGDIVRVSDLLLVPT